MLYIFKRVLTNLLSLSRFGHNSGWLRADSLEELVGLDVSYHGRSTHGENGDIKREYIEAYNRYKGTIRKESHHGHNNRVPELEKLPFSGGDSHHSIEHQTSPGYYTNYNREETSTRSTDKKTEHTEDTMDHNVERPESPEESPQQ